MMLSQLDWSSAIALDRSSAESLSGQLAAALESRIATLQEKLRMATVIDSNDLSTEVVGVGSIVHVKDEKTGKSVKYTIVGSAEANPDEAKLSNESPVGRALIGHKRNDIVAVQVPRGPARKLKITKIDVGLK